MKKPSLYELFLCLPLLLASLVSAFGELATPETVSRDPRPRLESRAGNSVDTATGAFRQELKLISLQDYIALEFNPSYNSFLTTREGDLGYGWTHPYEGRIESVDKKIEGDQVVFLDGNIGMHFRYAGKGNPFTPLDAHNRYDILEIVPESEPDLAGLFRLKRLNGRIYLFLPGSGRLLAIFNRNQIPIVIDYVSSKNDELPAIPANPDPFSYARLILRNTVAQIDAILQESAVSVDADRIARVSSGDRQLYVFYHPIRYNPFSASGHLNQIQYLVHGDSYTFFQYDEGNRLSRIYDPVSLETIAEEATVRNLPDEGILQYQINVSATETDRLIRVRPDIVHPKPWTLKVLLQDPSGRSVQIHANDYKTGVPNLFLGDFLGRNPAGTWTVTVQDVLADGVTGTINGFRMQRSDQPANWTQYHYDSTGNNRLLSAFDGKNQLLFWNSYDANGRIERQGDGRQDTQPWRYTYEDVAGGDLITTVFDRTPLAHASRFRHDRNFNLKDYQDALGNGTQYTYDPATQNRTSITDPRGNTTSFAYNVNGLLASVTRPNNAVTRFGHDEFPLTKTDGSTFNGGVRGNLTTVSDALGSKSTYHYDEFNRLESSMNALEIGQSRFFDQDGNLSSLINKGGNGVFFGYEGGLVTSANVLDAPEELLEYDSEGKLVKMIDADGVASTISYDKRGNIIEISNAPNHAVRSEFDHRNRKISETDANGNVTRYEYDGNGNRIRAIDPLQCATHYEYDAEDRLISVTDPAGNITRTIYDAAGRTVARINALGHTSTFSYDKAGNLTAAYSPTGIKLSEITYNELDLPSSITDAQGNRTTFDYDARGERISETDPLGRTTQFKIDPLGRLDRVIDPSGRTFQRTFLEDDVVEKIIDADGKETRYTYTDKNEVASITTPRGAVTSLTYTDSGKISRFTPPSGKSLDYSYDEIGRLVRMKHLDPSRPDIVYSHDRNGNVVKISTQARGGAAPVTQITREYDALNRLISNTDAFGNTVRYSYNAAGLVEQLTYPDSKVVRYDYDAANRLRRITDWADRVTEYSWDGNNSITSIAFSNGTTRHMKYDASGRLTSREDLDATGEVIVGYQYGYDANGFITSENLEGDIASYEPPVSDFRYDADNRLIEKDGVPIAYDADGNVTQGPISGQGSVYEWDYHNNLARAHGIDFQYDVEDRLVGWQNGGQGVEFATVDADGGSQILASKSSSGITSQYVYGIGLAYEVSNGQIKVHHYDERGSTTALSDASGQITGLIAYSPFGTIISEIGITETLFKYGGSFGIVAAPNGLNYMRLRWYSPEINRFLSMDSVVGDIELPATFNRYIYAANNPINFHDPEGDFFNFIAAGIGAVVGAVTGAVVEIVSGALSEEGINWNNVGAAAIGGFVGGAIAGLCPVCGSIGGAVGAGLSNGLGAAFNGKKLDGKSFAIDVGAALVTGGFLDKTGVSGFAAITGRLSGKRIAAAGLGELTGAIFGVFGNLAKETIEKHNNSGSSGEGGSGRTGPYISGATSTQTGNVGANGEYEHLSEYQSVINVAGRPPMDPPTTLPSF